MSSNSPESIVLSKNTIKRLIKDIQLINSNSLTEHGIYYSHSDTEILEGKALIIGPEGTPYANGFYLFEFKFPENYPHSPPVVKFCTNDSRTRMNPNLYRNGKVCLSILNTWRGDAWTGCQTISTVLLALVTVLNSNPLLNEPGINETHQDVNVYNRIIAYKNIETAIYFVLNSETIMENFECFSDIMHKFFLKNYKQIIKQLSDLEETASTHEHLTTKIYNLSILTNYEELNNNINLLYKKLVKLK